MQVFQRAVSVLVGRLSELHQISDEIREIRYQPPQSEAANIAQVCLSVSICNQTMTGVRLLRRGEDLNTAAKVQ